MNSLKGRILILLLVAVAGAAAGAAALATFRPAAPVSSGGPKAAGDEAVKGRFHCPMHPTMISDKPGDCPICGMRMVPLESGPVAKPRTRIVYRSTMNPSEISGSPGKDSMGMEMVREEIPLASPDAAPGIEGRATVMVTDSRRQLIGVRVAPVARKPLVRTIEAVGRVTADESRLRHVHTKISGWVEKLEINETGVLVKEGQPLLTIYSPELVASGEEYLLALRARDRVAGATLPGVRGGGDMLVESARRRLLLFDLTPEEIDSIEKAGRSPRTTTLFAPASGHVIARQVTEGEKIDQEMNLLDIADLSHVWVMAEIYEYELPFVHLGQKAKVSLSYLPGRTFEGRITLVYPVVSDVTRTVQVRLDFDNPGFALKPGMFASVEIQSDLGPRLIIPASAVVSTGERDIAYVEREGGLFEPRELKLGAKLPDSVEVLEGLAEGERILISGNFLVDSESKLKSALAAAGTGGPISGPGDGDAEPRPER